MNRHRTFGLLFTLVIASLVVIMLFTYRSLDRFNREHQAIRGGHLSLRVMEALLSSIKEAESALMDLRRDGLTSTPAALAATRREFDLNIAMLRALSPEPDRSGRLDSLDRMGTSAFEAADSVIAIGTTPTDTTVLRRIDAAVAALRATRGPHGRMVLALEGELQRSRLEEQHTVITAPLLLLAFGLVALATVSLLFIRVLRATDKAASAEQEIQHNVAQLNDEVRSREFAQRSLRRVLDSSISGIMAFRSVRDRGRIVDFEWILLNHQAEVMLGRSDGSLLGARMLTELPATASSGLFDRFVEVATTGNAIRLENVYDINGLGLHLDVHGVKLEDGLVVTYTDVSDRERQRSVLRESERLALTGKIARTVAHEVRNPLTNVLLALDQMKEDTGAYTAIRPYAEIVQRNAERIAQLITEMLESSRPRDVDRKPAEIGAVLNDTVELVRDRIELQRMGLSLDIAPDLPVVMVDREEIELALSNIIINAIEAMEQGTGHLRIGAAMDRGHVKVSIEDNGKGMNDENIARLFDPFYTGKPGGMGLGLTTARSILSGHGVHVDVTSQLGGGTSFSLVFPTQ